MAVRHEGIGKRLWVAGRPAIRLQPASSPRLSLDIALPCIFPTISNGAALHGMYNTTQNTLLSNWTGLGQQVCEDHADEASNAESGEVLQGISLV